MAQTETSTPTEIMIGQLKLYKWRSWIVAKSSQATVCYTEGTSIKRPPVILQQLQPNKKYYVCTQGWTFSPKQEVVGGAYERAY